MVTKSENKNYKLQYSIKIVISTKVINYNEFSKQLKEHLEFLYNVPIKLTYSNNETLLDLSLYRNDVIIYQYRIRKDDLNKGHYFREIFNLPCITRNLNSWLNI